MLFRLVKKIIRRKKLKEKRIILNPVRQLKEKTNYTDYTRIEKDGCAVKKTMLKLPTARNREEVVCNHYLSFLVKNFIEKEVGVRIVKRDQPWDFNLKLSNGMSFNVEITSIADNSWFFEKKKREELYNNSIDKREIRLRTLIKLSSWFRDDKALAVIEESKENDVFLDDKVANPFYQRKVVFVSDTKEEEDSLYDLIFSAIENKNKKNHEGKNKTVLIIDNRTTKFDLGDFEKAAIKLVSELDNIVFPEIYLYTGYYSDIDGTNFEASFGFLKMPQEMLRKYYSRVQSGKIITERNGINYDSEFNDIISNDRRRVSLPPQKY